MANDTLAQLIAAERMEMLDLLRTLSDDDWLVPSLCDGWSVRDVVAHLLWDHVTVGRYLSVAARYRRPDRINQYYVDQWRDAPTSDLVAAYGSMSGGWLTRVMPGGMLADLVVHQQDVRRPLRRPRTIDPVRLRHALAQPNRYAHSRRIVRGVKLVATDIDWTSGDGPDVRGTGEALALAITGRHGVLDELRGEGVPVLAQRIRG